MRKMNALRLGLLSIGAALLVPGAAGARVDIFDDPDLRVPDVKPPPGGATTQPSDTTPSRLPVPGTGGPAERLPVPGTGGPETTPLKPPTTTPPATNPPTNTLPRTPENVTVRPGGTTNNPPPVTPAPPPPPDPAKMFQTLYGAEAARVEQTPATKDDLELARKLSEAARLAVESPGLQRLMLDRAYTYASKDPAGVPDAMRAVDSLRQLFPSEGNLWDDRSLELQEKLWKTLPAAERLLASDTYRRLLMLAADRQTAAGKYTEAMTLARRASDTSRSLEPDDAAEIKELIADIGNRQRLDRRATELLEKLAKSGPSDTATHSEATELIVGVLPRPADLRSLSIGEDKALRYLLSVATLPDKQINATHAAWMGDYFRRAAERPQSMCRPEMLRAASAWYAHYLAMHLPLDEERLRVLLSSQQVNEALSKIPGRLQGFELHGSAVALLTTVEPERHKVSGNWTVTSAGASIDAAAAAPGATGFVDPAPGLLTLPISPGDAYEVTLQFVSQGASEVGLVLPVGAGTVAVSRSGHACQMSDVKTVTRNLRSRLPDLSSDTQRHTLYVRVVAKEGRAGVLVALDGTEAGRWEGPTGDLTTGSLLSVPNRAVMGVFARGGKALIADVSLHTLRGTPRLVYIPRPTDLPIDGSRPRDAVVSRVGDRVTYTHNGATVTFDAAAPGGNAQINVADPNEEVRIIRVGFTTMMANSNNLVPLGTAYPRYLQLLKMSSSAPKAYGPADAQKLAKLFRDHEMAPTSDGRQGAEQAIFAAMHVLADHYQRSITTWAKSIQKSTSPGEFQMIVQFGKRGY